MAIKKPEASKCIHKILTISTKHVSKATAELLDDQCIDWVYDLTESGWLVRCDIKMGRHKIFKLPAELVACIKLGDKLGCKYIKFDESLGPVRDLEDFVW